MLHDTLKFPELLRKNYLKGLDEDDVSYNVEDVKIRSLFLLKDKKFLKSYLSLFGGF